MPKSRKLSRRIKQKSRNIRSKVRRSRNIKLRRSRKVRSKSRRKIRSKARRSRDGMLSRIAASFSNLVTPRDFAVGTLGTRDPIYEDFKNEEKLIYYIVIKLNRIVKPEHNWTTKEIQDILQNIQSMYKDRDLDDDFFKEYIRVHGFTYNSLIKLSNRDVIYKLRGVYTNYIEGKNISSHGRELGTDEQYEYIIKKLEKYPDQLITGELINELMHEVVGEDMKTKLIIDEEYVYVPSSKHLLLDELRGYKPTKPRYVPGERKHENSFEEINPSPPMNTDVSLQNFYKRGVYEIKLQEIQKQIDNTPEDDYYNLSILHQERRKLETKIRNM